MEAIKKLISNWKEARKKRSAEQRKEMAQDDALCLFNIGEHEGMPVILYNHVVISVPQKGMTGDQLIQSMLKLREIYVQSKTCV